ncbi:MAG: flagellar protein FlgN [Syntrophales bacterium]|nr:flagellar protein FlgN [Syntrophales bacterium]
MGEKESLKTILILTLELYRNLEEVLVNERKAIIKASLDDMISVIKEKERIVREIALLWEGKGELKLLFHKSGSSRNVGLHDSSESDLVNDDRVFSLIKELKDQCSRVHSLNLANKELIESAISYLRDWLLYLQNLMSPHLIYAKGGKVILNSRPGCVINREG